MKYRKKPVIIDAFQWSGEKHHTQIILHEIGKECKISEIFDGDIGEAYLAIKTLEGVMRVSPGDWIIKLPDPCLRGVALDTMTVGAPHYAGVSFYLVNNGLNGLQVGNVPRFAVHVVNVQGGMMLAVSAIDTAAIDLVISDPLLDLSDTFIAHGIYLLSVAGIFHSIPSPGSKLICRGTDSGWTRSTDADGGTIKGIAPLSFKRATTDQAVENVHTEGIARNYTVCKPDIFDATYERVLESSPTTVQEAMNMDDERQARLLTETRETADRLNKLNAFMATDAFPLLPREDKDLLYSQQRTMSQYVQILGKRLERAGKVFEHAKAESPSLTDAQRAIANGEHE